MYPIRIPNTCLALAPRRSGHRAGGTRAVYLPEGLVRLLDGEFLEGPRNLRLDVPLDRLPLYARGGAIIPRMPRSRRIPEDRVDPLSSRCGRTGNQATSSTRRRVTEFICDRGEDRMTLE